jgi:hypothetical protein
MNDAFQSEYGVPLVFVVPHTLNDRSAVYFTCSSWMKKMRTRSISSTGKIFSRALSHPVRGVQTARLPHAVNY